MAEYTCVFIFRHRSFVCAEAQDKQSQRVGNIVYSIRRQIVFAFHAAVETPWATSLMVSMVTQVNIARLKPCAKLK